MQTLGIIGGIGPESTIAYYRLILAAYQQRVKDGHNPRIIINSISVKKLLDLAASDLPGLTEYLLDEIGRLADGGADFGLLAANTAHVVFDAVQALSPIPLISIVEATCEAVRARGLARVGLFGTRFTTEGSFYSEVFTREGLELILPDAAERALIHDIYMNELLKNIFLPETRARLLTIVDRLIDEAGMQALILGGTELPLILTEESYRGIPFLDTTRIHAEKAAAQLASG
jgi:aspartate racemase